MTEWIFQIRSVSGYLLSPALLALKKENSGDDFLLSGCDFFLATGASVTFTEKGCLIETIDEKKLYLKHTGLFDGNKRLSKGVLFDDVLYLKQSTLEKIGYLIKFDKSEMLLSVDHTFGLPIDKKNQLMDEIVSGTKKEKTLFIPRSNYNFNRFNFDGYHSPSRTGSLIEGDFDLLGGEFVFKECDEICLSFLNWSREWRYKNHTYNLSAGNYDYFYFPGKYQRLKKSLVLEINKKNLRQKFSLNYGKITDYFIYRNGVLIRRGRGSLKELELDLSEENYLSNYTVRFIDTSGRIQTYDLYNGLGLLGRGDYSFSVGGADKTYAFANTQLGLSQYFNVFGTAITSGEKKYIVKRAKTAFENFQFEVGELVNEQGLQDSTFEQGDLSFFDFNYLFNHRKDNLRSRDNKLHTLLFTPSSNILQFQHKITDNKFFENEMLAGRQVRDYFIFLKYTKFSNGSDRHGVNISTSSYYFNIDLGVSSPWDYPSYYALISGSKDRIRYTANLDVSKIQHSFGSRLDYVLRDKNLYSTFKASGNSSEIGIGIMYSFFPDAYALNLNRQSQSIVLMNIFLDLNNNGLKDPEDSPLSGVKGSLITKQNHKTTDESGKMYFEIDGNYNSVVFEFDESSFKEMHYLPPDQNIKLKLNARKVNSFDIPIHVNGVLLIDCSKMSRIRNVKLFKDDKILKEYPVCTGPLIIEQLDPGVYNLFFEKKNNIFKKRCSLNVENRYFKSVDL